MDSVAPPLQASTLLSDESNRSAFKKSNSFIVSTTKGAIVSFVQKDGTWVATVTENLPTGCSSKITLPVYSNTGITVEALADYSPEKRQKLVHIEKGSDGKQFVYVGRIGLLGGGKWNYDRCSKSGCRNNWFKCSHCKWGCYEGQDGGSWGVLLVPGIGPWILVGRELVNYKKEGACDAIQFRKYHCKCICGKHMLCPQCYACPH
ncbi:hypothetical protein [Cardinium endosymbiont of Tipula unca]|uniref:hypothetical protein n=1 Tax=Cardinium endosymbiont of Tipula unca TaxID=3066216 RepID=UPI0030CA87A1